MCTQKWSLLLQGLQRLNLNACQKITDSGVIFIASANINLRSFSIYWNLKYVKHSQSFSP